MGHHDYSKGYGPVGPAPQEHNVVYTTLHFDKPWSYDNYLKTGGYSALRKIIEEKMDRAAIIRNGAEWFLNLGKPNNGGPKVFSVSGHVNKPGNYEIRLGTPFADLLEMAGGMREGRRIKGVIPGGSSMPVLPGETMMGLTMDYDSIQKAGSGLGSGAVIVMDDTTCMVRACQRIARFYFKESCGQCTPCREGTGWMWRVMERLRSGDADIGEIDMLQQVTKQVEGHTICALGDAAAWPIQGLIRHFRPEIERRINERGAPVMEAAE